MTIPSSVEAIAILVILFIPGYLFLQFTKSAVAHIPQSVDARYFLAVVVWGGIVHAIAIRWEIPIIRWYSTGALGEHVVYLAAFGIIVLLALPILLGIVSAWLIQLQFIDNILKYVKMDYISRTPSAWEYAIRTGAGWVRIQLRDGSMVGGVYGDKSFSDPSGEQDIFLERLYVLDENNDFDRPVPNNVGIWIPHEEIQFMVFSREASVGNDPNSNSN